GDEIALSLLPILDLEGLGKLAGSVVLDRDEHHVALDAEMTFGELREAVRDSLVRLPIAARLPDGVHRRGKRMDEGMHVRGVEVVLLVPGRRRQHDVGVEAARRHPEIESDDEIEFSLWRGIMPGDFLRLPPAHLAEVLALEPVTGTEEMLQEIFVALPRGA